jgi:hypothetical protein
MIINENQLHHWVRSNEREAQEVIVELIGRLVAASVRNPTDIRFPRGDSIGQPGEDGYLETDVGFPPFVSEGRSYWEIGTSGNPGGKATEDYKSRTEATEQADREQAIFVFVTPSSAVHGWGQAAQTRWRNDRLTLKEWRDVRVIDGTRLIEWLSYFPSVERWLAIKMGIPAHEIESPEERWTELSSIGNPPPLKPELFLANRSAACDKLNDIINGNSVWLKVDTHFPSQMADFVAAYIATLNDPVRVEVVGRCLIVSTPTAWSVLSALRDPHILIADFDLDDTESSGMRLLERAKVQGHSIVFAGSPGGVPPHPNRVSIPNPTNQQVIDALKKAGYKEERARTLAQKSSGGLSSLLRCLQNLSSMPEWAQATDAADLAIAEILGSWNEGSEADRLAVEKLSGKAYGEWIGTIREIALRPGTPLIQQNNAWRFGPRYEGWYALGPRLFDEHLDRVREVAVAVLREQDPALEMPPEERYAAGIRGKALAHSRLLRKGLAESLALIGSHPIALKSSSFGKAETTARLAVRETLAGADWERWVSLNDVLPLLAEAAPGEFLEAVENGLNSEPCPFDSVFSQEGSGFTGRTYMTGLLWALETLAWDADHLTRVVVILGELAARDPGGKWSNRPENSLWTILLPWFPQTSAPVAKRQAAVATLLTELPDVAWKLLLNLLPQSHSSSSMTRKPEWREIIPDDWSEGVTNKEYYEQISAYAELAIKAAKEDTSKLIELVGRMHQLSPPAREKLLIHLRSDTIASIPASERLLLWTQLIDLVSKHRRYEKADWAMESQVLDEIAAVANSLAPESPVYRHQRLFTDNDFDLYEGIDNFEEEPKKLEHRRQKALNEVYSTGGIEAILELAHTVKSPVRVGIAFGAIASATDESNILPTLLLSESTALSQFAGGFVWARFRSMGWEWVDSTDKSNWTAPQKAHFLAYLPFTPDTWERVSQSLMQDEFLYWSKANANPYDTQEGIEMAIDRLLEAGRVREAIGCIERIIFEKRSLDTRQAIRALRAAQSYSEVGNIDAFVIVQIIKALQNHAETDQSELAGIEWTYLPLLDADYGTSPKLLDQQLANDPAFFCEMIRMVFRSNKEDRTSKKHTEQEQAMVTNAYRLLFRWKTPPGTRKDGSFDGDCLNTWLKKVKADCAESGHLEVALERIGHVLFYSPPDPDGLWLHCSVASVLNAKDAADIRRGFEIEIFNSRGAYIVDPQGGPERELANTYRRQAEEVEMRGYHRLANTLKDVAASYDREAERASKDSDL